MSTTINLSDALDDLKVQIQPDEDAFVDGDKTKLDGIENNADVTDAGNVAAAGALMKDDDITSDKIIINENVRAFNLNDVGTIDGVQTSGKYTSTTGGPNVSWIKESYIEFRLNDGGPWELYENDDGEIAWESEDDVTPEYPWLVKKWNRVDSDGGSDELIFTLTDTGNSIKEDINKLNSDKANLTHAHNIDDVTNLQSSLDNKVSSSFGVSDIRRVTQEEYNLLAPDDDTLYVVVDGVAIFVELKGGRSRNANFRLSGSDYPKISVSPDTDPKFLGNVFGSSVSSESVTVSFVLGNSQLLNSADISGGGDEIVDADTDKNSGEITFNLISTNKRVLLEIFQEDDS